MIQGNDSFRLIVRRGPQPNQSYDLNKDSVTLGRDITNDIVINDPEVSRHHLRLTRGPGGFTIEDLGSTNGTFANGQRLTGPRALRPGDMVGLGETVTLAYEAVAAQATMGGDPAQAGTMLGPASRGGVSQPMQPSQPIQSSQPVQPSQPYAPAQPSSPYAPPTGYPPPQQGASQPVQPSQQGYSYSPAPAPQYPPATGYTGASQASSAYGGPSGGVSAPVPGTGYGDYDPYAVREDEQSNTARLVLIGCGVLAILCCCSTLIAAVAVDQLCLWPNLPIIYPILNALGYVAVCP